MELGSVTALRLKWDYLKRPRGPRAGVVEITLRRSPLGPPWLLYVPKHVRGRPLTLVHGVTARASEDVNLVHLARCIAGLGHPCITPPLDGLAHFQHTERDVSTVADAVRRTAQEFGNATGVWGFSYGASYTLSAASRTDCRDACHFIVAFGAYFELEAALEHQRRLLVEQPNPDGDDADILYLRYTLLACQRERLALSQQAWEDIESTLAEFTLPGPLETKKRALLEHARELDYAELMASYQRRSRDDALSPARKLAQIACPVALLHDPNDRFIPRDQVHLLAAELDERAGLPKTPTLTTPMLSHVQVNPMRSLLDAWRLIRLLSSLFV